MQIYPGDDARDALRRSTFPPPHSWVCQPTFNRPIGMSMNEKPKGPASYFPSIEKKYGQPIQHWLDLTRGMRGLRHMEMVARLKTDYGLGHGHANAIVGYVMAEASGSAGAGANPSA
jgi:hypothetical protein